MALVQPGFSVTMNPSETLLYGGPTYGTAMPVNQTPAGPDFSSQLASGLVTIAPVMAIMGAINSAVGSYYQAESQKNALQMQAQNQRFAAEMGRINQRIAERSAVQIGREGQARIGRYGMGAAQARAGARAGLAGRGAVLGAGTAGEVIGSMDVVREIDRLTMSASNVRAEEAARMQAANVGTQALMSELSAANLQAQAGTIYPGLAMGTSLLTSAADIGGTWARNRRLEELLSGVSTRRF